MNDIKKLEKAIANVERALVSDDPKVRDNARETVLTHMKAYGIPITGGNRFNSWMERNAINQAFNVVSNNVLDSFPSEMTLDHYFELLRQAKYWQNLFIIQNWDELTPETKKGLKVGFAALFMNGYIGWVVDGKNIIPYILVGKIQCDVYGYPQKCFGYPAGMCFQFGTMKYDFDKKSVNLSKEKEEEYKQFKKELTPENCVFCKWNTWGYGAWLLQMKFINALLRDCRRIDTCAALTGLLLKQKSIDGQSRGIEEILDNNGVISEVAGKEGTFSDKFETMDVGQAGNTLKALIDMAEWRRQWFYSMEGRRYNINEKQERNINSEVMYSQLNFDVLENEHLRELSIAFGELKAKFGIDIQVSSPIVSDDMLNSEDYDKLQSGNPAQQDIMVSKRDV